MKVDTCCICALVACHVGVGWGGVHVSVPWNCFSIECYAAQMCGEDQLPHWNNRCRMECCQRLHAQLVVFKKQRSSLVVKCWQWRYMNLHTHLQQKNNFNFEAPALRRREKKVLTCSDEMSPKPTRNANLAKFSRKNLAKFGFRK